MAYFGKYDNKYKYFEAVFLLFWAGFGSSTSPNSANKAV